MQNLIVDPVEWMPGWKYWWLGRYALPLIAMFGLFLVFFALLGSFGPVTPAVLLGLLAVIVIALLGALGAIYSLPSTKRIGFSPGRGLLFDIGLRIVVRPWADVVEISPQQVTTGRGIQRDLKRITRQQYARIATLLQQGSPVGFTGRVVG